jgi:basic membrane protein A
MVRKFLVSGFLSLLLTLSGCGGGGDDPGPKAIKAAWVYIGPPGDHGWTYAHDQGRKAAEAALEKVTTTYLENVAEADSEAKIQELADAGNDIVFTTSFGYLDPTLKVAAANPAKFFEHCSGNKTASNSATYFGRMYQARYLTGMVAGQMTQSKKIGYVAAFPIPEVIYMIDAFTLGVRSITPDATVQVEWTNSWYDPVTEKQLANSLIDDGCDVISQHQDSTAPVDAAKERGKYAIGYHSDMLGFATDTVLTSAIWNWGAYYTQELKAVQDDTWTTHAFFGSLKDGTVDLGAWGAMVPEGIKNQVAAKRAEIEGGTWDVFYGPIKKQDGTELVAAGGQLTDDQILSLMEFVEGVVGTIPTP